VKKANWEYYEPRTEHGSSLSPCVYALLATDIGNPEWGYKYFLKTATIDLTGESKQYAGTIYIGGTHPAANGGAWMSAVLGFGGIGFDDEHITINPKLPSKWESLEFNLVFRGQRIGISMDKSTIIIQPEEGNYDDSHFIAVGKLINCKAGQNIIVNYI
jgi:nigerose phosphorylase